MRNYFLLLLLPCCLLLQTACGDKGDTTTDTDNPSTAAADSVFNALLADYHEERLWLFPMDATRSGDDRFNHRLPIDISETFRDSLRTFYNKYLALAGEYANGLGTDAALSRDILSWECQANLDVLEFPSHLMPINQFYSLQLGIAQQAGGTSSQPFNTVKDYENWLQRLQSFTTWCDTALANMRRGIAQGIVLQKPLVRKVIPQLAALADGDPQEHIFYTPIQNMPEAIGENDRKRLSMRYREMISKNIIPAYRKLHDFMAGDYLAASRETTGYSDLQGGRDHYDAQIRYYTTTTMSADEIFELGKSEVARLEGEMEKVKAEVGFDGDLKAFFAHLRSKPELMPFTEPREVIDHFNAIHEKMKPNLERLFDLVPKTAFEVRRTEAFREASGSAEYNPGTKDGSRPGIFYVPIPDATHYNILSDEDLFLHEAIPGHHYQISLQQENEALPEFRRILWYSSYGEGWALYSESLGKELGLYTDPYQYFGMLSAEMHRAIRLVVDVGMHVKGWSREEAIQYSLDHEAEPEASITSEIERYMSWPGQALSYKIGQLKILELRARAEQRLGDKFDVRAFHREVLEAGCVPLKLLEAKIDRWISGLSS